MLEILAAWFGKLAIAVGAAFVVAGALTFLLRKIVFWLTVGLGAIVLLYLAGQGVPGVLLGVLGAVVLLYATLARLLAIPAAALKMLFGYILMLLPLGPTSSLPMYLAPVLTALTFAGLVLAPKLLRRAGVALDGSTDRARGKASSKGRSRVEGEPDAGQDASGAPTTARRTLLAYCATCEAWGTERSVTCVACHAPLVRAVLVACPDCPALVESDALHRHQAKAHAHDPAYASVVRALSARAKASAPPVRVVPSEDA